MREEYLSQLRKIINNFDAFKEIALNMKWVETETTYCHSVLYESGLYFYTVRFSKGYLKNHFSQAFIQTMITVVAYDEEWEPDFWAEMPYDERCDVFQWLYRDYFSFQRLRMKPMTAAELKKDVHSWFPWTEPGEENKYPWVLILPERANNILSNFAEAEALWIGEADSYALDEHWLAINDDDILYISFYCGG